MDFYLQLVRLGERYRTKSAERALAQCEYALKLSEADGGAYDRLAEQALSLLTEAASREDSLSKSVCKQAEELLLPLSERAKRERVYCVPHAHIDMNWMWGYAETVSITLDTFRTILRFLEEYPTMTFAQSQASCYQIVERYDPDMLEAIKELVRKGRWEVSASTWVEADKNMSGSESLAMQNICARRYLSRLFSLPDDAFTLDFEPDTFGHSEQIPELLAASGVRYYYHCRGSQGALLCRWEAPSGRVVLVNREENWYTGPMTPSLFMYLPGFCKQYGVDCGLRLFGLGDHGGGPTRKDIEQFLEMAQWPVFPRLEFGHYRDYFKRLELFADRLPVEKGERNFMFTGCYSSQSRIKAANRLGENRLVEAQVLGAMAALLDTPVKMELEEAWQKHLFNQFHDILPGSGMQETRECAMGNFQEVLAGANTAAARACRAIEERIDTSRWVREEGEISAAETAGYGYAASQGGAAQLQTARGLERVLTVFNPTAYEVREYVETTLWDWDGRIETLCMTNAEGEDVPLAVTTGLEHPEDTLCYWEHSYRKITFLTEAAPYGYATYRLHPGKPCAPTSYPAEIPLVTVPKAYQMDNGELCATFDPVSMAVTSLRGRDGTEYAAKGKPFGVFRCISEQDEDMSAWTIGRYKEVRPLTHNAHVTGCVLGREKLRQSITYELRFLSSRITVTVSLTEGAHRLDYAVNCDWQERAIPGDSIPQLSFAISPAGEEGRYRYEIPFGFLDRDPMELDVPSLGIAAAVPVNGGPSVGLLCKTKYGFRASDGVLAVTLLRSTCYPDPYPDNGIHSFDFSVFVAGDPTPAALARENDRYCFPLTVLSGRAHPGTLPPCGSVLSLQAEHVRIVSVKRENGSLLVRLNELEGRSEDISLTFAKEVAEGVCCDIAGGKTDGPAVTAEGCDVRLAVPAKQIVTVKIRFADGLGGEY